MVDLGQTRNDPPPPRTVVKWEALAQLLEACGVKADRRWLVAFSYERDEGTLRVTRVRLNEAGFKVTAVDRPVEETFELVVD